MFTNMIILGGLAGGLEAPGVGNLSFYVTGSRSRALAVSALERSYTEGSMLYTEYSATELRRLLQELFPHRRLVLSQFTFYNQVGVARPTGETFRRKRRCYRLIDILPIACILALKEQGIPLKNIASVPGLIQEHSVEIFKVGRGCRLSGMGETIHLHVPGQNDAAGALASLLESEADLPTLFWGFDVGELSEQLCEAVTRLSTQQLQKAA